MIIAIDGPAASGKGTIAKRLAAHYGLPHLDTGLLYRAVAKALLDAGQPLTDRVRATSAALAIDPGSFDERALKAQAVSEGSSIVSAIPEVRAALLALQRAFVAQPLGAVLDGRDIGTVIAPNADAKIFVTASSRERARRRALEFRGLGLAADESDILADILKRDDRDRNRTAAPLIQAGDAYLLDTTHLDVEQSVAAAIALIEKSRRR